MLRGSQRYFSSEDKVKVEDGGQRLAPSREAPALTVRNFGLTLGAEMTGSYADSSEGVARGLRECSVRMASIASAACRPASGARCP